jgi:ABC-type branched-subunit amino acid transport system permease subunit
MMPSFVAIIVGGVGSLPGTLLGGLLIGVASGVTTVFLAGSQRGGDLRHDGGGAARAPARTARRRRA